MTRTFPAILLSSLVALSAISPLSGCFGGGKGGGGGGGAAVAQTAAAPDSFPAGVVMTFGGGASVTYNGGSSFSYSNTGAAEFTASIASGTFQYAPVDQGVSAQGTLILRGTGAADGKLLGDIGTSPANVTFLVTRAEGDFIKEATLTIGGRTFTATFSGTPLPVGVKPATGTITPPAATATDLPASAVGSYNFIYGINRVDLGAPYNAGDTLNFNVSPTALSFNGKSLTAAKRVSEQGEFYWFNDGDSQYIAHFQSNWNGSAWISTLLEVQYYYKGAYAGKFATSHPTKITNNAASSIVGKKFILLCTAATGTLDGTEEAGNDFATAGDSGVMEVKTFSNGDLSFYKVSGTLNQQLGSGVWNGSTTSTDSGSLSSGGLSGTLTTVATYNVSAKTLVSLVLTRRFPRSGQAELVFTASYDVVGQTN